MQWRKLFCISLEEQKQEHICESPTLGMMYVPSSHSSENVDLKEDHGRRMLYAFEIRCCRELLNIRWQEKVRNDIRKILHMTKNRWHQRKLSVYVEYLIRSIARTVQWVRKTKRKSSQRHWPTTLPNSWTGNEAARSNEHGQKSTRDDYYTRSIWSLGKEYTTSGNSRVL